MFNGISREGARISKISSIICLRNLKLRKNTRARYPDAEHISMMKFIPFKLIGVVFLVLLSNVDVRPQSNAVDRYINATMTERRIPGAAVAVIRNGRIVKMKGYGLASIEFRAPATPQTVFEIGSVSKQFTAACIMLLVQDGTIDLDAKISTFLPGTPDIWRDVTVRTLLTHTSGIRNYTGLPGFELSRRLNRDSFIKTIAQQPLDFPTRTKYSYSNSGYNLLGYIVESVSGMNYWDFMRTRIFNPLGMAKTANRDPKFVIPKRANGYEWIGGDYSGRDGNLTDLFSAGAIVSTMEDMTKWESSLRNATLLTKESLTQMWTPLTFTDGTRFPYGFAYNIKKVRGHKLLSHGGQTAGFGANISRFADHDLTVIALTNLGEDGMGSLIALGVAKLYEPALSLKTIKAAGGEEAAVTDKVSAAIEQRMKNSLDASLFSTEVTKSLSSNSAKERNSRIASFGQVKRLIFAGSEKTRDAVYHRYVAHTVKRMFLWRFVFNSEGMISEMVLEEEEPLR